MSRSVSVCASLCDFSAMMKIMRMDASLATLVLCLLLSSCGTPKRVTTPADGGVESASGVVIPAALDRSHLGNVTYTIISPTVRIALTKASLGFTVGLKNGTYEFPEPMALSGFTGVRADFTHLAYGDVNHDGMIDAVLPLLIDHGDYSILEIAGVTESGSTARHFASFPIGKADLKSVSVINEKIHLNFTQVIPGDQGPRNTDLQLELPRK